MTKKIFMTLYLVPSLLAENTQYLLPVPYLQETLKGVSHYLVENERTARRFLSGLPLGKPIRDLTLLRLDKKTTAKQLAEIFHQIPQGSEVAVLSEAGAPCIADPGSKAVAYAHKKGWQVMPIPGPTSIVLALMGSGFNGQSFTFHGYLPINGSEGAKKIKQLESVLRSTGGTQLFMETPFRNNKLFRLLCEHLHPETQLCVAANLTSSEQFLRTLSVREWNNTEVDLHKKPTIFAIGQSH